MVLEHGTLGSDYPAIRLLGKITLGHPPPRVSAQPSSVHSTTQLAAGFCLFKAGEAVRKFWAPRLQWLHSRKGNVSCGYNRLFQKASLLEYFCVYYSFSQEIMVCALRLPVHD